MQSWMPSIYLANSSSFIEENHEYKLKSQARQSQQVPQRGRPSQDMMSFWGQHTDLSKFWATTNI
jgi:RAT1-interacting protein